MRSLIRREDASMISTSTRLPAAIDDDPDVLILPPIRKETVGLIGLCVAGAIIVIVALMVWFATSSSRAVDLQRQAEAHAADMDRLNQTLTDLAEAIQLQQPPPAPEPAKVEPSAVEKAASLIKPEFMPFVYGVIAVLVIVTVIGILSRLDQSGVAVPVFCFACLIVGGMMLAR